MPSSECKDAAPRPICTLTKEPMSCKIEPARLRPRNDKGDVLPEASGITSPKLLNLRHTPIFPILAARPPHMFLRSRSHLRRFLWGAPGSDRLVNGGHLVAVDRSRASASAASVLRIEPRCLWTKRLPVGPAVLSKRGLTSFTSQPFRRKADAPNSRAVEQSRLQATATAHSYQPCNVAAKGLELTSSP